MQEKQKALLNEIIEKLNTLFEGALTDQDKLVYVSDVIKGKLMESVTLIRQAANNTKEQFATSPDLNSELTNAIMEALEARPREALGEPAGEGGGVKHATTGRPEERGGSGGDVESATRESLRRGAFIVSAQNRSDFPLSGRRRWSLGAKTRSSEPATPDLTDIPPPSATPGTAANVQFGIPRPPQQQLLLYSPGEWEEFIREWVHHMKKQYSKVLRVGGAGDMGIDVGGFADEKRLFGVWDNYQCKHYANALTPSEVSPEIAKVLWYSFNKQYAAPRRYYFVAPRECGISLKKLLLKPEELRAYVRDNWGKQCASAVTEGKTIALGGEFEQYFDAFNFAIFDQRTLLEALDEHRQTPYHAIRFGGGLPGRPKVVAPPFEEGEHSSRYVQQLFEAYSDHTKAHVADLAGLGARQDLTDHFHRQREFFYHAEALRNFARDTVPAGTFEDLQSEVHAGVADVAAAAHADGYARVNAVTQTAVGLRITSNALISVTKVQDCKGICHQLANEDRVRWRKP